MFVSDLVITNDKKLLYPEQKFSDIHIKIKYSFTILHKIILPVQISY